ncbi:ABC transporter permease [Saccharibacillus alkalitolerans]|uniref:FtsX-like permease family protein n=1 Tax=Saccharibacillus alkalitolerans TaxID=2705290 RepID=A0ABX0F813_9BACL|nr:ABC transporter permease [Saccharibacillus alkalitolerans]NGZ75644.1 FtsX-like permease family protein [Saccharibacillus alkalitolerans]
MIENLILSLGSLRANKMRSFLTMLGIIIGISSVIAVISVGNAMTSSVTSQFAELGINNVTLGIQKRSEDMNGEFGSSATKVPKDSDRLSMQQIETMMKRFPEIETLSLSEEAGRGKAKIGRKSSNVSLTGVNAGYAKANKVKMLQGRYVSETDVKAARSVIVVSDRTAKTLYGSGKAAIGNNLIVYTDKAIKQFTVIGVYQYTQSSMMGVTTSEKDLETSGYIPVSSAQKDAAYKNFTSLTVIPRQGTDLNDFTDRIGSYLTALYQSNKEWDSYAYNMKNELESTNSLMNTLSLAIAAIAGIALIVGGIGVMNIMLVSVTERTHEIGVRKALGAKDSHIRTQFVAEAILLSVTGGLIGIVLGVALGFTGSQIVGAKFVLSGYVVLGTLLFSMLIGVFFGYYPANKAAKLNTIDALRYE